MISAEQIQTMLEQNQKLMEQNQQLIGMLSNGIVPKPMLKPKKKATKKENQTIQITSWYYVVSKKITSHLAVRLMVNIKHKGLWMD